ncbi:MAG: hypothetical protein FXF54_06115 [Kosmotoga sp.]|nr:MAG: hypothetical protein FXF54_06115 [Kosmotoga sp.]
MKRRNTVFLIISIVFVLIILSGCPGTIEFVKLEIAKQQFLTHVFEEGEPEEPAVALYLGEVEAGDRVYDYVPSPDQQYKVEAVAPNINKSGFLFYLDLAPGAFYNHPGRIVVMDETGEALYEKETQGWPVLNGEVPEVIKSPTDPKYYQAVFWNNYMVKKPKIMVVDYDIIARLLKIHGAVVVNGLTPSQNLYYEASQIHDMVYDAMVDLISENRVVKVDYPDNYSSDIVDAVEYLILEMKVNRLTIYIIAHGGYDSMNIGGYSMTPTTLINLMNDYPNVQFNIIIESCHAGSWIQYPLSLTSCDNLILGITTTTAALSAYADVDYGDGMTDYDVTDVYVEWTSDFLKNIEHFTSAAHWNEVITYAGSKGIDNLPALFDKCFRRIKGTNVPVSSYTFTERLGIQTPMIYRSY